MSDNQFQQGNQFTRSGFQGGHPGSPGNFGYTPQPQDPQQSYADQGQYSYGMMEKIFGPALAARLKSPSVVGGLAVVTIAIFSAVIFMSYPSENDSGDIPLIRADSAAYKVIPQERGGAQMANQDSTLFDILDPQQQAASEMEAQRRIENLLGEPPVDPAENVIIRVKNDRIINITEAIEPAAGDENAGQGAQEVSSVNARPPQNGRSTLSGSDRPSLEQNTPDQKIAELVTPTPSAPPSKPAAIASRASSSSASSASAPGAASGSAQTMNAEAKQKLHKPGTSPDTLAFVRSVLDKKDGNTSGEYSAASSMNVVAPAAGTPGPAEPGAFYIQLGSVKDQAGASKEWGRLQSTFSSQLGGLPHRIERADLGARGIFYRIQAGPISKTAANERCSAIKAQKPGGCLVVR